MKFAAIDQSQNPEGGKEQEKESNDQWCVTQGKTRTIGFVAIGQLWTGLLLFICISISIILFLD